LSASNPERKKAALAAPFYYACNYSFVDKLIVTGGTRCAADQHLGREKCRCRIGVLADQRNRVHRQRAAPQDITATMGCSAAWACVVVGDKMVIEADSSQNTSVRAPYELVNRARRSWCSVPYWRISARPKYPARQLRHQFRAVNLRIKVCRPWARKSSRW
jgi:hypothetical protein